ncbi:hypothetical protein RKD29_000580 [Streptomyces tendae]
MRPAAWLPICQATPDSRARWACANRLTCVGGAKPRKRRTMSRKAPKRSVPLAESVSRARCTCPAGALNCAGRLLSGPLSQRASSKAKPRYTHRAAASRRSSSATGANRLKQSVLRVATAQARSRSDAHMPLSLIRSPGRASVGVSRNEGVGTVVDCGAAPAG